jgi:hypothetical protein
MPQLTIKFSDDASREGCAAIRLIHIADLHGNELEELRSRDFRLCADGMVMEVETGFYAIRAYWRAGSATFTTTRVDERGSFSVELAPRKSSWAQTQDAATQLPSQVLGRQLALSTGDEWNFLFDSGPVSGESIFVKAQDPAIEVAITRRHGDRQRGWLTYRNGDIPVMASLPLGPVRHDEENKVVLRPFYDGLPRLAFSEERPDIAVMCDMLSGGNSENEMLYLGTFGKQEIDELLEVHPLHYMAYALANTHSSNGRDILRDFPIGRHEEWLPDLLVLRAWYHLFCGRDGGRSWDIAASLFEQSVKVGVPYFSRSVKFLSEGCSLLGDVYPGLEKTRRLAWWLATRTLPTETFTTVRLDVADKK